MPVIVVGQLVRVTEFKADNGDVFLTAQVADLGHTYRVRIDPESRRALVGAEGAQIQIPCSLDVSAFGGVPRANLVATAPAQVARQAAPSGSVGGR